MNNKLVNHNDTRYSVDRVKVMGVQRHFQQYFSCFVEVCFIGGENHRPAIPLINHNMLNTDTRTKGTK